MENISEEKFRCQSCGMPLDDGFWGVEADRSLNREYCKFCYSSGKFTEPDLTLTAMIQVSISHMMRVLKFPEVKAREIAETLIPKLKRWSK